MCLFNLLYIVLVLNVFIQYCSRDEKLLEKRFIIIYYYKLLFILETYGTILKIKLSWSKTSIQRAVELTQVILRICSFIE